MIEKNRLNKFKPLSDNQELINKWLDLTIENGVLVDTIQINENENYNIFELKENFFGLRVITNNKEEKIASYPIFDEATPTEVVLKGIGELENTVESIRVVQKDPAVINSFALDHLVYKQHLPDILGTKIQISFMGWLLSLERQFNPPQVKQPNGKLVTTKGSSIFYNIKDKPLYEYIYQFNVESINSIIWNNYIEIIQIKTTFFKTNESKVNINLYVTERSLQNEYYPKKGEDIMGIMLLNSSISNLQ